jgi:hypothetical protein
MATPSPSSRRALPYPTRTGGPDAEVLTLYTTAVLSLD